MRFTTVDRICGVCGVTFPDIATYASGKPATPSSVCVDCEPPAVSIAPKVEPASPAAARYFAQHAAKQLAVAFDPDLTIECIQPSGLGAQLRQLATAVAHRTNNGKGLLLAGPTGIGKTFTAALFARAAVEAGLPPETVLMGSEQQLLVPSANSYGRTDVARLLANKRLIVLDDVGHSVYGGMQGDGTALRMQLLDMIQRRGATLVTTTNIEPHKLSEALSAAVYGRLLGLVLGRRPMVVGETLPDGSRRDWRVNPRRP